MVDEFTTMDEMVGARCEFFNRRAEQWDAMCHHDRVKLDRIISLLEIEGHERILDVGTGTGVLIPFYQQHLSSGSILAFDMSERMIEVARAKFARARHPNIEFKVANLYETRFRAEFDIVMCYSCLPHFPDKSLALSILGGALSTGGRFVVAHSDGRGKINRVHMEADGAVVHDHLPTARCLREMLLGAALRPVFEQDDADFFIMIAEKG